jgi:RHH-type rel operon transcriptional repressor/antitoxin RelB
MFVLFDSARLTRSHSPAALTLIHLHGMLYLYSEVLMLAIRLPQSIEKRLEKLARRTGRTKTYYVREAILEHLEDLEDMYLAEGALERIRSGEEQTIPLKDVVKRHGLQR